MVVQPKNQVVDNRRLGILVVNDQKKRGMMVMIGVNLHRQLATHQPKLNHGDLSMVSQDKEKNRLANGVTIVVQIEMIVAVVLIEMNVGVVLIEMIAVVEIEMIVV